MGSFMQSVSRVIQAVMKLTAKALRKSRKMVKNGMKRTLGILVGGAPPQQQMPMHHQSHADEELDEQEEAGVSADGPDTESLLDQIKQSLEEKKDDLAARAQLAGDSLSDVNGVTVGSPTPGPNPQQIKTFKKMFGKDAEDGAPGQAMTRPQPTAQQMKTFQSAFGTGPT